MSTSQSTAFIERLFKYENNIGHDDPQAEQKLRHKLKQLQDKQTMFKAINAINRKSKLTIQEKVSELVKLIGNDISRETALGLLQPDYAGRTGIPSYELTNNNGVMNNVLERLAKIARVEAMPEFNEKRNGVHIYIDKDENRIFVDFKGKPSQEVIDHLSITVSVGGHRKRYGVETSTNTDWNAQRKFGKWCRRNQRQPFRRSDKQLKKTPI